ncbi:MAG: apolipoprotein N-acyltransferase [Alphaproteobacteria bacterium]|nr:apolipoprotein N-acyltransferase [Alphaproteobacteria bacterium]
MLRTIQLKFSSWVLYLIALNPLVVSGILGGLAALSMPPLHYWFILPLAFSGFLILLENEDSLKKIFWLGWVFGFGYFLGSLYWLGNAPRTLEMWYAVPFAAVGLPIGLAFFPAFVSLATCWAVKSPIARVFAFVAFWSIGEWLRGHILTGLPWNLIGYTWDIWMLQTTSVIGIYGLSLLTVLSACIFATRHKGWYMSVILGICILSFWGNYRVTQSSKDAVKDLGVNLRIVQASIPQQTKWLAEHFQENLERYIALSHLEAEKPLAAVIWPESSVTVVVEKSPPLISLLASAAPIGGMILFGAPREVNGLLHTSLLALNSQGNMVGVYDKSHLVPFGEYMPLRSLITLKKLTYGDQDYTPGSGVITLPLPGLPSVSPLICYEAIFPHAVVDEKNRPFWMLNITNDAWYGHSAGPYQHLQIVRVRAIEEGMPLIRAANNGISAVIDSYGRILYRLELDEIGFIDFSLPKRLEYVTLYAQWGELIFVSMVLVLLIMAYTYRSRQMKKSKI